MARSLLFFILGHTAAEHDHEIEAWAAAMAPTETGERPFGALGNFCLREMHLTECRGDR